MNMKCERCQKNLAGDQPTISFGHDEILGQVLGYACIDCAMQILYEYKHQAETFGRLEEKLDKILEVLDGATIIPKAPDGSAGRTTVIPFAQERIPNPPAGPDEVLRERIADAGTRPDRPLQRPDDG